MGLFDLKLAAGYAGPGSQAENYQDQRSYQTNNSYQSSSSYQSSYSDARVYAPSYALTVNSPGATTSTKKEINASAGAEQNASQPLSNTPAFSSSPTATSTPPNDTLIGSLFGGSSNLLIVGALVVGGVLLLRK